MSLQKRKMLDSVRSDVREVIEHRNILRSLIAKNLYGKYRNSILGFAWNFLTPVILMIMYYIVFSEIRSESGIENRWLFIGSAIFLFSFLTSCITGGTNAFTGNAGMIKKMYIPKEILVLSKALSSMIVCIIGNLIVILVMIVTSYSIDWIYVFTLPLLLLFALVFGIGCTFFLSSIAVYVRDIQYALGSVGIALFILTPMRYMAEDATGLLGTIIWLNPLTYFIEWNHQILYWGIAPSLDYVSICAILAFVMLIIGYVVYRKLKSGFVKRL